MDLNKFLEKGFSEMAQEIDDDCYERYFSCGYWFMFDELDKNISHELAIKMILARFKTEIDTNESFWDTCCCCNMVYKHIIKENGVYVYVNRLSHFDD
jgi:hypothetical protein